jgi:hypothetical protein
MARDCFTGGSTVKDIQENIPLNLREALFRELKYIRGLGSDANLTFISANPGAFEAVLYLMCQDDGGTPVYKIIQNIETNYCKQPGLLNRLSMMRKLGLLEGRPGHKRSEVCLFPSAKLVETLGPVILNKYSF